MKQLIDGQQLRIHIPNENSEGLVRHEGCGCGLKHNIYIGRIGKDVTLAFVRVAEGKEKAKRIRR
ncbi:MAG: hypothetical protein M0R06_00535 [Sphaerochaeta sp.]|jgi:hypothetical protein|nr:hypothetical protein [Sphaerochaeta sp.]